MQEIVKKLKSLRKDFGKSQKDIADQIGVSKEIIGKWENGKRGMTLKNAVKYANALGYKLVLKKQEE